MSRSSGRARKPRARFDPDEEAAKPQLKGSVSVRRKGPGAPASSGSSPAELVGRSINKHFGSCGHLDGKVSAYDARKGLFTVQYEDSYREHLQLQVLLPLLTKSDSVLQRAESTTDSGRSSGKKARKIARQTDQPATNVPAAPASRPRRKRVSRGPSSEVTRSEFFERTQSETDQTAAVDPQAELSLPQPKRVKSETTRAERLRVEREKAKAKQAAIDERLRNEAMFKAERLRAAREERKARAQAEEERAAAEQAEQHARDRRVALKLQETATESECEAAEARQAAVFAEEDRVRAMAVRTAVEKARTERQARFAEEIKARQATKGASRTGWLHNSFISRAGPSESSAAVHAMVAAVVSADQAGAPTSDVIKYYARLREMQTPVAVGLHSLPAYAMNAHERSQQHESLSAPYTQLGSPNELVRMTKSETAAYARSITRADVVQLFGVSMEAAASELGLGLTMFKKLCRRLGICEWPKPFDATAAATVSETDGSSKQHTVNDPHQTTESVPDGGGTAAALQAGSQDPCSTDSSTNDASLENAEVIRAPSVLYQPIRSAHGLRRCDWEQKMLTDRQLPWHTTATAKDSYTGQKVCERVGKYVTQSKGETLRDIAAKLELDLRELVRYNNSRMYDGRMKPASRLPVGTTVLFADGPGTKAVIGEVWATNYVVWAVRHLDGTDDVVGLRDTEVRAARWEQRVTEEKWCVERGVDEYVGERIRRTYPVDGKPYSVEGTIVGFLPAGDDPEEDYELWHVMHDDGDDEDLERDQVEDGLAAFKKKMEEHEAVGATKRDYQPTSAAAIEAGIAEGLPTSEIVSDYERARQENIRRNQAALLAFGLGASISQTIANDGAPPATSGGENVAVRRQHTQAQKINSKRDSRPYSMKGMLKNKRTWTIRGSGTRTSRRLVEKMTAACAIVDYYRKSIPVPVEPRLVDFYRRPVAYLDTTDTSELRAALGERKKSRSVKTSNGGNLRMPGVPGPGDVMSEAEALEVLGPPTSELGCPQCRQPSSRTGHTCRRRRPLRRMYIGTPQADDETMSENGAATSTEEHLITSELTQRAPGSKVSGSVMLTEKAWVPLTPDERAAVGPCRQCEDPTRRVAHTCARALHRRLPHGTPLYTDSTECLQCLFPSRRRAHTCSRASSAFLSGISGDRPAEQMAADAAILSGRNDVWSNEEDQELSMMVSSEGEGGWDGKALRFQSGFRTGSSLRHRWLFLKRRGSSDAFAVPNPKP